MRYRTPAAGGALAAILLANPVSALELQATEPAPTVLGLETALSIELSEAVGAPEVRWDFGDGERTEFTLGASEVSHTYQAPGHYPVIVVARDDVGFQSFSFVHTVHNPLTPGQPQSSMPLLYEPTHGIIVTANTDNDTITFVDATSLTVIEEVGVHAGPIALGLAPDGRIWVVHRDDFRVALVDPSSRKIVETLWLPYASQPMGVVFSEQGDAYVPLMALGEVLRIDAATGAIIGRRSVAPFVRGISLTGDGSALLVTRFISPDARGEVFQLDPQTLNVVTRYDLLEDTTTEDTDVQGRGLPNYLFSVSISPDGREAWVPGKKDNMSRGLQRDGLVLTQDNTVRPLIAILDLDAKHESLADRIDLDDRNLPRHVTFSPLGDYAFVTLFGSNQVEVWDTFTRSLVTGMRGGKGPVATVLSPANRLFVLGDLSRSLVVYDMNDVLRGGDLTTRFLDEVPLVGAEKLSTEVLLGKQLFSNADDPRMASEGYLSCASCHIDGFEDGRVWEFADRGEGLRNTTSLLGRSGTGHGPVHWSGNFDEIQDFEAAIRSGQGGLGFMTDADFLSGTRSTPLGDKKAGLSPGLDAIAAYVSSLDQVPRSPHRRQDGEMTADALLGELIFEDLGCGSCHTGPAFTDSAVGVSHDVGTLTPQSGQRLGEELKGIDTPTLLGVWQTAPYLHDGSAETLLDVLTTKNPEGLHGATADRSKQEISQLIAYLMQLETDVPAATPSMGEGGQRGQGGAESSGSESDGSDSGDSENHDERVQQGDPTGCGCRLPGGRSHPGGLGLFFAGLLAAIARRRIVSRASLRWAR